MSVAAVILAGGRARRLGMPKPTVVIGGETLLDRAVRATRAVPTVVVGPVEPIAKYALLGSVSITREDPPFSGPAAAIAAGLDEIARRAVIADRILVVACDLARAPEAVALLLAHEWHGDGATFGDGVAFLDGSGRPQWLCGVYRATTLRAECSRLRRKTGLDSLPARLLFERLQLTFLPDPDGLAFDIDTPADLAAARARTPA
ncbi:NTP transferase domain-containing protein [Leifsonia sp. fls2-241-R2A-40a]|uniref:molybdenum cofactor guanylyltransferase n=1 Tax=Leifsonia sp. fls2-241-R2A-40a TaxID=3040290 RepID=UPI00254D0A1E|nr:NTP transferase domain-containing protein [Leifsonia sp. fls2-241-R2A-40a]